MVFSIVAPFALVTGSGQDTKPKLNFSTYRYCALLADLQFVHTRQIENIDTDESATILSIRLRVMLRNRCPMPSSGGHPAW